MAMVKEIWKIYQTSRGWHSSFGTLVLTPAPNADYDYNGQPFHFRVSTDYPLETQDIIEQFRKAVAVAKPCRAVLDSIEFAHSGATSAFTATASIGVDIKAAGVAINI